MTALDVSLADARRAEEVQHTHRADKNGWCTHHLRCFRVRVPATKCDPWRLAQLIIVAYDQQHPPSLPEGPVAGQFRATT